MEIQGDLQIWGGYLTRWSKHYVRLQGEVLLIGTTKEEIQSKVHLKISQIITSIDEPVDFAVHTGCQTIYLRASSIDEKVRWCKTLKAVQRELITNQQNHELRNLQVQLGRNNRAKLLEQMNVELWKCHAQLEQRLENCVAKIKSSLNSKALIDKLRITTEQFKFKTSEILHIIEEEIRDLRKKRSGNEFDGYPHVKDWRQDKESEEERLQNETKFFSFDEGGEQRREEGYHKSTKESHEQRGNPLHSSRLTPVKKLSLYKINSSDSLDELQKDLNDQLSPHSAFPSLRKMPRSIHEQRQAFKLKNKLMSANQFYRLVGQAQISRNKKRSTLPAKFTPQEKFSLFSTLVSSWNSSGQLNNLVLPITAYEPLSLLQKGCEQMYYSDLLRQADNEETAAMRMVYVAAFVTSTYSVTEGRTKKAFTPLLGETYEFIDEKRQFEFIGEQVNHNPPITAIHVRSDNFELVENWKAKLTFTGNNIRIVPESKTLLRLQKYNDNYLFNKCTFSLSNLLIGKTVVENLGEINITCKELQSQTHLQFREQTLFKKDSLCVVEGAIKVKGELEFQIAGHWNRQLTFRNVKTKQLLVLWRKEHKEDDDYYNFNDYTFQLNHLSQKHFNAIAPTDSRLRPDQRALEHRMVEIATEEKQRLEDKQRAREQSYESSHKTHKPVWFTHSIVQGEEMYLSNNRYWDEKIKGRWLHCMQIY